MRWNAGECPKAGERWKCITDLITHDVIHWLHVQETTVTSEIATDPV
ncbi:hypothetical protein PF010_g8034 [Phytophthora fragariae]|uniref:Uncharacterized protein n=1 Tax=Phytophthora fragariae TaxID=53985 RepID=A0A6G0LFN5_9STRA|nr:hypothetical protein PF010_g8034 [Phytophthora fragariae]